jgi:predicted DNA-binding transcriptional regulator YafY
MASTSRLLALLSLLQARRDWPGALLAARLEVSERTVRRDVDRLRELGYDVHAVKGPDGGYRLDAGAELPPLLFDDDQAVAIAVALRAAATAGAGIEEGADRALATLRQVLPARLRSRVDALEVAVIPRAGPVADPAVLLAVSAAVRDSRVLRFDYGAPSEERPPRRAEPCAVVASGGRWYLVAWDLDRRDWRIFRVDRIRPSSHAGAPFAPREIPGGDAAAYVAGRFRGAGGPGPWPCSGEVLLARPAAEVAPFVEDGAVEVAGADRCRVVHGAWSWTSLAARIGQLDAEVEVVGPPELRAAFAALAARFAVTAGTAPRPTPAARRAS